MAATARTIYWTMARIFMRLARRTPPFPGNQTGGSVRSWRRAPCRMKSFRFGNGCAGKGFAAAQNSSMKRNFSSVGRRWAPGTAQKTGLAAEVRKSDVKFEIQTPEFTAETQRTLRKAQE